MVIWNLIIVKNDPTNFIICRSSRLWDGSAIRGASWQDRQNDQVWPIRWVQDCIRRTRRLQERYPGEQPNMGRDQKPGRSSSAISTICDQRCAEPRSCSDHRQHCVLASTAVAPVYRRLPEHYLRCMARRFMGLRSHLRSARTDFTACTVPTSESQHPGY